MDNILVRIAVSILIIGTILGLVSAAADASPEIYDSATGKYLGNLNSNQYDPDSVNNSYGRYGNRYSPESINNEYGQYGSKYSPDSPNNPYNTNPPIIIDRRR